jgi:hypothetical protein
MGLHYDHKMVYVVICVLVGPVILIASELDTF